MEATNKIDFEQVVHIMNIATISKIRDAVTSVRWSWWPVYNAMSQAGLYGYKVAKFKGKRKCLESVWLSCEVYFEANEVPGIISPFVCPVKATIKRNSKTGIREIEISFGKKVFVSRWNRLVGDDVEALRGFYATYKSESCIGEFVSNEFDFHKLGELYSLNDVKVTKANVPLVYGT